MSFEDRVRNLAEGQSESCTRVLTDAEVRDHEDLTGDRARSAGLVPIGMLGGMISELLGTRLPGRGTNWLKQSYHFEADGRVGEAITARVEITRLRPDKALVNLASTCTGEDGRVLCTGESLVLVRELELV